MKRYHRRVKHSAEFTAFTKVVNALLSVSREEMQRREAEYRAKVDANPKRRGPKRGSLPGFPSLPFFDGSGGEARTYGNS